jgi:8-oxo-dGTP pyrophosphatase MutT (NUDIX family)
MKNILKNILYKTMLGIAKIYWKIFKPVTAGARIILVTDKKILLVQPRTLNYWNLPGGGMHKNEDPEKTAIREIYEEIGIEIDSVDFLLGTYISSDEGKRDTVYIFVKKVQNELLLHPDIEIGRAQWFEFGNLPAEVTPRTKMRITEYLAGKKNIKGLFKELHL